MFQVTHWLWVLWLYSFSSACRWWSRRPVDFPLVQRHQPPMCPSHLFAAIVRWSIEPWLVIGQSVRSARFCCGSAPYRCRIHGAWLNALTVSCMWSCRVCHFPFRMRPIVWLSYGSDLSEAGDHFRRPRRMYAGLVGVWAADNTPNTSPPPKIGRTRRLCQTSTTSWMSLVASCIAEDGGWFKLLLSTMPMIARIFI